MSSILTTESIVLLLLFNKLTKQSIFLFFVWVIRVAFRCSGRGGRFRIFLNFPIFLWIPSVRCILLSLFKRTRQSTPFSCYTATATGQHGKRELPDEDFARVLRGLHRARHQLRLLQISSSSRPAPLDHSHSHRVKENTSKDGPLFWAGFFFDRLLFNFKFWDPGTILINILVDSILEGWNLIIDQENPTPRISLSVRPSVTEKYRIVHSQCTYDAWVTRPERPKGAKDEVKQARRAAD